MIRTKNDLRDNGSVDQFFRGKERESGKIIDIIDLSVRYLYDNGRKFLLSKLPLTITFRSKGGII